MKLPKIAKPGPYKVLLEANTKYFWCSCGLSQGQPFCDNSHMDTGFLPVEISFNEDREMFLCGCKKTRNKPFCDGSH